VRWDFDSRDARAAYLARHEFVEMLRREAAPASDLHGAEIVFGELVGNAVRHAPGRICIDVRWEGRSPVLSVRDTGQGFDVQRVQQAFPVDPLSEGRRGLYLVLRLTRRLAVLPIAGDGKIVSALLAVERVT
jgi:anti-sigma regulatory factor (Ser/Thr protein kinase)